MSPFFTLVIVVLYVMAVFGTGGDPDSVEPPYNGIADLDAKGWSRILGILIAFVASYSLGFFDGRRTRKRERCSNE